MREEIIKKIRELHAEMRTLTLQFAKVSVKKYDRLLEKVDYFNDYEINCMLTWLTWLKGGAYTGVVRVYRMPPNPEITWKNYVLMGIEGLQEQRLMEVAAGLLKEVWQSAYKPERVIRVEKTKPTVNEVTENSDSGIGD